MSDTEREIVVIEPDGNTGGVAVGRVPAGFVPGGEQVAVSQIFDGEAQETVWLDPDRAGDLADALEEIGDER